MPKTPEPLSTTFTKGMGDVLDENAAKRSRQKAHPMTDKERIEVLVRGAAKVNEEVCQTLGKALGYPWFKDDQANFPGATEESGVCVGEHVAESIADEAARRIEELRDLVAEASRRLRDRKRSGMVTEEELTLFEKITIALQGTKP